ncbi:MAG: hypothetical protein BM562_14185 [Alphaproteobacteria bacterium MedPE-SWcel]|nr:MAG: hypothetical protein BM562_14185 [Alphaproteobacteria bacterium MedPE-SWcel]
MVRADWPPAWRPTCRRSAAWLASRDIGDANALPEIDGKGAWRDNVFVERLWRTIKYEEVYLRVCASVSEVRAGIGRYLGFYSRRRPHTSLDGKTPDWASFNQPMPEAAAA